jgi:hypothetical protein
VKLRLITVAIGLSLALSAARAIDILAITEHEVRTPRGNFSAFIVTFNGEQLSGVNVTGETDFWTIELPSGFAFSEEILDSVALLESRSIRRPTNTTI